MHIKGVLNRRDFIRYALTGTSVLLAATYAACTAEGNRLAHIKGGIVGPDSGTGHLLRNPDAIPAPTSKVTTDVLIIGGGISGLSAKRWLQKSGQTNVLLVEMADHFGGNAHSGRNAVSAYPWGAHYIPIPDIRNKELLDFLAEENVVTGYDQLGLPIYNDYYMCHDPEERLFINGMWQEGIIPNSGVPEQDKQQIKAFLGLVAAFKAAKGKDGKDAFCIPLDNTTEDDEYRKLDKMTFSTYLAEKGFTSPYLLWYLEYCCKDDYGCNLESTSAWAGIHYFACRKGKGANAEASTVLTWPEGNGFLSGRLRAQVGDNMRSSQLVFKLTQTATGAEASVYDVGKKTSYTVAAKKVIVCSPQFVNKHLLRNIITPERLASLERFSYAPWVIANITINSLPVKRGMPLCWDNVIYGKPSVGYINANHQDVNNSLKKVLTFYLPLSSEAPTLARTKARDTSYAQWLEQIVEELEYAHNGITECIEQADLWIWAHGMIAPTPGMIWGADRRAAVEPIDNTIFFAHSDLSGVSIFEEAFYQGIRAAREVMGG